MTARAAAGRAIGRKARLQSLGSRATDGLVSPDIFHQVVWFDAADGVYRGMADTQFEATFFAGDVGPYGIVEAPGLGLKFNGIIWFAVDATTGATMEFAYRGTITDICAALS